MTQCLVELHIVLMKTGSELCVALFIVLLLLFSWYWALNPETWVCKTSKCSTPGLHPQSSFYFPFLFV